jgi:hypothetical protein
MSSSHDALVRAFSSDKSPISHRLRTLEGRGLLVMGRSPGGQAEYVCRTAAGHHQALQLATESLSNGARKLTNAVPGE